jgi:NADH:ubiquinone oxidoreductase subunit 5 (subunit L)/multisubunit Na+/H+ antiporter MnhA subunit
MTLLVARRAAIAESDGKKIVALSTLRQLGLIFMSLSAGAPFVCLFHLLMHALAKANLFLIVGNLLHLRFSQQDSRQLSAGSEEFSRSLAILISILSLSGVAFSSGFLSKDLILLSHFSKINSIFT